MTTPSINLDLAPISRQAGYAQGTRTAHPTQEVHIQLNTSDGRPYSLTLSRHSVLAEQLLSGDEAFRTTVADLAAKQYGAPSVQDTVTRVAETIRRRGYIAAVGPADSPTDNPSCMYRATDGRGNAIGCAAGLMIPDTLPGFDTSQLWHVVASAEVLQSENLALAVYFRKVPSHMLTAMQRAHDSLLKGLDGDSWPRIKRLATERATMNEDEITRALQDLAAVAMWESEMTLLARSYGTYTPWGNEATIVAETVLASPELASHPGVQIDGPVRRMVAWAKELVKREPMVLGD